MRVITDREVFSYAGDEKPKKTREERRSERKQKVGNVQEKFDKIEKNPLFQAGAGAVGQFLTNKYGPSKVEITTNQDGNLSLGSTDGGLVPVSGESEEERNQREKAKRKKTIIISSVIGGVVILGIIGFVIYRKSSKK